MPSACCVPTYPVCGGCCCCCHMLHETTGIVIPLNVSFIQTLFAPLLRQTNPANQTRIRNGEQHSFNASLPPPIIRLASALNETILRPCFSFVSLTLTCSTMYTHCCPGGSAVRANYFFGVQITKLFTLQHLICQCCVSDAAAVSEWRTKRSFIKPYGLWFPWREKPENQVTIQCVCTCLCV